MTSRLFLIFIKLLSYANIHRNDAFRLDFSSSSIHRPHRCSLLSLDETVTSRAWLSLFLGTNQPPLCAQPLLEGRWYILTPAHVYAVHFSTKNFTKRSSSYSRWSVLNDTTDIRDILRSHLLRFVINEIDRLLVKLLKRCEWRYLCILLSIHALLCFDYFIMKLLWITLRLCMQHNFYSCWWIHFGLSLMRIPKWFS